jgi:two-component system sensor histidine kinase UhpB
MPSTRARKKTVPVADQLAESVVRAEAALRQAGKSLHDEIGPLLSTAGLRLQLLRMDFPDATERVREVMDALDDAMERVRALSQELNPSPIYRAGLKNALEDLLAYQRQKFPGKIEFDFATTSRLPIEVAVAMYEAARVGVAQAVEHGEANRIDVAIRGARTVTLSVKDNGAGRRSHRALAIAALLARHAGLTFEVTTGKVTIVRISYVLRRPSR